MWSKFAPLKVISMTKNNCDQHENAVFNFQMKKFSLDWNYFSTTYKEKFKALAAYKINTVPDSKLKRRSQIVFYCTRF